MDKQTECGCWNCKYEGKKSDSCKTCITQLISAEENKYTVPSGWKAQTPKICEILGVEVGEEFTFPYPNRTYDRVFVKENGQIWERVDRTGNTHKLGGAAVCWLINNAESIRKYPLLTEKEIAICKALGAKWISQNKGSCDVVLWYEKPVLPPNSIYFSSFGRIGTIDSGKFPSIKPTDLVEVPHD